MQKDTIYALSTAPGKSGVAIIRVSGPASINTLRALGFNKTITPRQATYCQFTAPDSGEVLDHGLFIFFPSPHSFTGEDVLELHLHGSIAVINDVLYLLSRQDNLRSARPGEFSKRAFLNGKLDLTMAEGLVDLINSETSIQRKVALRQYQGELEQLYDAWRNTLIKILSRMEAFIDFPEEDIPYQEVENAISFAHNLAQEIDNHLKHSIRGEVINNGMHVVIFGPPNAGKSSLLNWLSQKEVAIVSNIPGTTRDVLQVRLDIDGFLVIFYDTAGLRQHTTDEIEQQGMARALDVLNSADLKILLLDVTNSGSTDDFISKYHSVIDDNTICLLNKIDQEDGIAARNFLLNKCDNPNLKILMVSLKEQSGLEQFIAQLKQFLAEHYAPSDAPIITKIRYREALQECVTALRNINATLPIDLTTEELRAAAWYLGSITGRIDVEEVLDEIFSTFCIGK